MVENVTSYVPLYLNFVADLKYKLISLRRPIQQIKECRLHHHHHHPTVPYSPQPTVLNYKTERLRVYSKKNKQASKPQPSVALDYALCYRLAFNFNIRGRYFVRFKARIVFIANIERNNL